MERQAKKRSSKGAIERLDEFTSMALSDRISFMEAVLSPPKPTEAAIQAAKRYNKLFKAGLISG